MILLMLILRNALRYVLSFALVFAVWHNRFLTVELEPEYTAYKDYTIMRNVLGSRGVPWKHSDSVTLVLHSTLEYVGRYLELQISSWRAPISLAVFVRTPEELKKALDYFKLKELPRELLKVVIFYKASTLIEPLSEIPIYPINVARNIARREIETQLFLSGDIENILCCDYNRRIKPLANRLLIQERRKTVLVHRRFEERANLSFPESKSKLRELYKTEDVVPFHKHFYEIAHRIPGLEEWMEMSEENVIFVFEEMNYTNAEWEPQFVAANDVSFHDERFPYRARSNTHLGALMCRQNYTFSVVTDLFSVHSGIKRTSTNVEIATVKKSKKEGYTRFVKKFRKELDRRFPTTKHTCPRFKA
ncbi:hypothetical protein L596_011463 [Steinernema carpocapsae]|uniref:Beta-1,4-glucuronyltransferase 1 n=1 Tax=Steinernema carpocapsae TaxID=34508 RepID=A0A4U5NUV6_STECR|nr:hypothetical protein L596_011463 [Steinernema carpocapsae]